MTEKRKPGRPSKFDPLKCEQAERLCKLGATDKEIAEFFDVSEQTLNTWKHQHPEFLESLKAGKAIADMHLVQKLFHRAEGAEWTEDVAFKVKRSHYDDNGRKVEEEEVVTTPVKRAAPPDTTALIFWLKNRRSGKWRDKVDHEMSGNMTVNVAGADASVL